MTAPPGITTALTKLQEAQQTNQIVQAHHTATEALTALDQALEAAPNPANAPAEGCWRYARSRLAEALAPHARPDSKIAHFPHELNAAADWITQGINLCK